jgi:hypothetical protein
MRLKYMFADKCKASAHPFHVKSTWQPPVQNSVALENYLEHTKLKLASAVFCPQIDNISENERNAISALKRDEHINRPEPANFRAQRFAPAGLLGGF